MSSQFDATARISVDLKGFSAAASQVNRQGGQMDQVFRGLHRSLEQVQVIDKKLAQDLSRTMRIYAQISREAQNYAKAMAVLQKNSDAVAKGSALIGTSFGRLQSAMSNLRPLEESRARSLRTTLNLYRQATQTLETYIKITTQLGQNSMSAARGQRALTAAMTQMRAAMAQVQGLGEKEFQRLQRTLTLYQQMATALTAYARAQQAMVAVSQSAQRIEQAATRERNRTAEANRKLKIEEDKLTVARDKAAAATRTAAAAEERARAQTLRAATAAQAAQDRLTQSTQRMTQQQQKAKKSFDDTSESMFSLRSALQELEQMYRGILGVMMDVGTAAVSTAIEHESAFSQIARVTGLAGDELDRMQDKFNLLAAQLPVDFVELTRVAQLASQTGVANEQLIAFTDTIVRFSVTTGVTTEAATLMLSRIMQMRQLPVSQLKNLTANILALGITSAATEEEILKVTESIATVTDLFGLSIQATTGLSAALATLRVRPELSRGSLTRVFAQLNKNATQAGVGMDTLSRVMNMTADSLEGLLVQDPDSFFLRFIQGMSGTIGVAGELRRTLGDMGINAVRDIDVISRLANNYDLLSEQVQRSRVEFLLANKLTDQSAIIFDTARVHIDNMRDAWASLMAKMGTPLMRVLAQAANTLQDLFEILARWPKTMSFIGATASAVGLAAAGFLAYRIAVATAFRSVLAMRQAHAQLGGTSFTLAGALKELSRAQTVAASTATAQASASAAAASSQTAMTASTVAAAGAQRRAVTNLAAMAAAQNSAAGAAAVFSASQASAMTALGNARGVQSAAAASMGNVNRAAAATAVTMSTLGQAAALQGASAANQAQMNRNLGVSMSGLSTVMSQYSVQNQGAMKSQADLASATRAVNTTLQTQVGAQTAAAAAAGTSAAAQTAASTAMTAGARSANVLSTALMALRTHWMLALGAAGLLITVVVSLVQAFRSHGDAMRNASRAATDSVGGLDAYRTALVEDTKAAEAATGGIAGIEAQLRKTGRAVTDTGVVYRTMTVAARDLTGSIVDKTRADLEEMRVQRRAIEQSQGSIETLRQRARGQGAMAEAARQSLADMEALTAQEQNYANALKDSVLVQGERVQQLARDQFQQAILESGLVKTAKAADQLSSAAEAVGFSFEDMFSERAPKSLQRTEDAIARLRMAQSYMASGSQQLHKDAQVLIQELRDMGFAIEDGAVNTTEWIDRLKLLQAVVNDNRSSFLETQNAASVLKNLGIEPLSTEALKSAEAMDIAAEETEAYEARLVDLKEIYTALIDPSIAWRGETDEAIKSVQAFTERLQEQVTAQQEFAANMAVLAAQGYSALTDQLRKMGPEGAQAAAELVGATEKELQKLEGIARQAGDDYLTALAGAMDTLGSLQLGEKVARSLSDGISSYLSRTSAAGGDVQMASQRVIDVLGMIGAQQIEPKVALDIIEALGDLDRLQQVIRTAQADGSLDADGKAYLETVLYDTALSGLQQRLADLHAKHAVDANGRATLNPEQYRKSLDELMKSTSVAVLQGLLDAEGDSDLDKAPYEEALEELKRLRRTAQDSGSLDPRGRATLNTESYNRATENLRKRIDEMNLFGFFSPRGTASVQSSNYLNTQLPAIRRAAWQTGNAIQQALTRSATVSVNYKAVNNPPPRYMQAADGGWIRGPGGPREDKIHTMLSNKEFVVNAASAKKFAPLVEAINADRGVSRVISQMNAKGNRYADGGRVGERRVLAAAAPSSVSRRTDGRSSSSGPVFNIHNSYPQAEPTSVTVNRSLAYAATISGVGSM